MPQMIIRQGAMTMRGQGTTTCLPISRTGGGAFVVVREWLTLLNSGPPVENVNTTVLVPHGVAKVWSINNTQVTQEHDAKAFKEAQNINKSLSSLLGVCYVHVSQREHIPRTCI